MGQGTVDRRRQAQARRRALRRRRAILVAGVLVALLACATLVLGNDGSTAARGVRVAGMDVGGLDRARVEEVVRRRADRLMDVPLVIESEEPGARFRTVVSRPELGARPRVRRAVDEALEQPGIVRRALGRLGLGGEREVPLRFALDPARVDRLADEVAGRLSTPPIAAALDVRGRRIVLRPGRIGRGVDPERLRRRIRGLPARIAVRRGDLPPPIDDATAEQARALALRVVDAPVGVSLNGRAAPLPTDALWTALRFRPDPPRMHVELDPEVLHAALAPAFATREREARRATFRIAGDAVSVIPSRTGRRLDTERIARAIVEAPDARSVPARFVTVAPERTTAEARALRITAKVSEFTTPYSCCEPRVTNIARAAEILDGTIVPAGGRFSLNEALGERTVERGFVPAPQIAAGRLEDAVGGGVSQVATAVYNAAFFAGLQIVTHTPHQFYISRYPPGREATVSYGGPELVFVNDWDAAVLITATAGETELTVRFYSSPLGRRVETSTGEPEDPVEPETIETVDPELEPGERVVDQSAGGAGFTIRYTRRVLRDGAVTRDEEYRWTYDAQDAYVRVGPEPEPEPKPAPDRTRPDDAPDGSTAPEGTTTDPGTEAPDGDGAAGTTDAADPAAPPTVTEPLR